MTHRDDQSAETVAQQHPGAREGLLHRREVGTADQQQLHPPHLTENDERMGATAPALPANASGADKVTTAEHDRGIDRESMYDRRPEEDKNQPPSERQAD